MYIAVILDEQEGLTDDDFDMFYEIWQKFDPDGTKYIRLDQLYDLIDELHSPLRIPKPNKFKTVYMDIPICDGDLMFCVDVLDALVIDFFARQGNHMETINQFEPNRRPDEVGYVPVSSTLWHQRQKYCARLIQHVWRKHKQHKGEKNDSENTFS